MAKVRFEKGSMAWRMFTDFYRLCQEYWEPEDTDQWWEEAAEKTGQFAEAYGNSAFVRGLALAVMVGAEEKVKRSRECRK